jgi:hypothetical protein
LTLPLELWGFFCYNYSINILKQKLTQKIMKKVLSYISAALLLAVMSLPAFAADMEPPSDVEALDGEAYDGAVNLTWDEATDDTGIAGYVVYYGETSVDEPGESYDDHVDAGDVLEYYLDDLDNGTTYYFSVVAYDESENESIAWAPELELTPDASGGSLDDETAPQVSEVEALNEEEVLVVFSEEVVLPSTDAEDAFLIEDYDTFEELVIVSAEMYEEDDDGKTVLLTTDAQDEDVTYQLTVGFEIEDLAGNPIISGTSDTAIFEGSGDAMSNGELEVLSVEAVDSTHIEVQFSEAVVLSVDPSADFTILEEDNSSNDLEVLGVVLGFNDDDVEDASAVLTVEEQGDVEYVLIVSGLEDEDGNAIDPVYGTMNFDGIAVTGDDDDDDDDLYAGDEADNFLAEITEKAEDYDIMLGWDTPTDDVSVDQTLYVSADNAAYSKTADLEVDEEEYELRDFVEGTYWFKLTQTDDAGNESNGVSLKVVLAETGPGLLGLMVLSLGLGRVYGKRK